MAAPLAFHFGAQFQNIFESAEIEPRVFREASWMRRADFVVFGGDFGGEMILDGEQVNDLLLVCRIQKPALRFDAGGEKRNEEFAVIPGPGTLGEKTGGLISADELLN